MDQNDLKLKKLMKKIKNTYCLYTHSLPVWIWKVTHIVTVYDRIRPNTIIYDPIRQSYRSVYGIQTAIFKSLHIFIRSPYTVSVSLRIRCPFTDPVYDLRMPPFFTVNGCLRPCMFDLGHQYRSHQILWSKMFEFLVFSTRLNMVWVWILDFLLLTMMMIMMNLMMKMNLMALIYIQIYVQYFFAI